MRMAKWLALSVVLSFLGCSASSGTMEGSAQSKKAKSGKAQPSEMPSGDEEVIADADAKPIAQNPMQPIPEPELGGPDPIDEVELDGEEGAVAPAPITGTYLYCYREKVETTKATVYCATQDKATQKPFEISDRYISHRWSSRQPNALQVKAEDLPIVHRYNVKYTITAGSKEYLTAGLSLIAFIFEGTDINDRVERVEQTVLDNTRLEMFIQSQKPQGNTELRCLDRYRMQTGNPPQPRQVVTTSCGTKSMALDWYIRPDNKIAHVGGECLMFDAFDGLSVVGNCETNETPRFEFNGEQIKILGTNNCLGLKNQDASGVDYSASVACNTNDAWQRWKIAPASRL